MSGICAVCGLPKDLCMCVTIAKEKQKIVVFEEFRRFRKKMTVIGGLDKSVNLKDLAKQLKNKLSCGGTVKGNRIELQGAHKNKMKSVLQGMGFPEDSIEVK